MTVKSFEEYKSRESKRDKTINIRDLNEYDGMYDLQVLIDETKESFPTTKRVCLSVYSCWDSTSISLWAVVEETDEEFHRRVSKSYKTYCRYKERAYLKNKEKDRQKALESEYGPYIKPK